MAQKQNVSLGILLMVLVTLIFAVQDAVTRHLADNVNVWMVLAVRFWFFAAFATFLASRSPGGLRNSLISRRPKAQILRGLCLVSEIIIIIFAFKLLGLVETHAVFSIYPLIVSILSGPILGETVGWRRWTAVGIGFIGVLIVLAPTSGVFSLYSLLPLGAATLFAAYGLLTRSVASEDNAMVSFFWTAIIGAVLLTVPGLLHWEEISAQNWGFMAALCLTAALSHWLLIRAYEVAEASAIQPFAYLQLVWIAFVGVFLFSETLRTNVIIGGAIVVLAGVFTLIRARQKAKQG